eukprot:5698135-Amphidinium_carterae.1
MGAKEKSGASLPQFNTEIRLITSYVLTTQQLQYRTKRLKSLALSSTSRNVCCGRGKSREGTLETDPRLLRLPCREVMRAAPEFQKFSLDTISADCDWVRKAGQLR